MGEFTQPTVEGLNEIGSTEPKNIVDAPKKRFSASELGPEYTFEDFKRLMAAKKIPAEKSEALLEDKKRLTVLQRHTAELTDDERKEMLDLQQKTENLRTDPLSPDEIKDLNELSRSDPDRALDPSDPNRLAHLISRDSLNRK